jgi:(2R)-3-sulfolactate dehydrogenase (NADP+)
MEEINLALVTCKELEKTITQSLILAGASESDAQIAATAIAYAESSGLKSHGLVRLDPLISQLKSGKVNKKPNRTKKLVSDSLTLVDGDHGIGLPAAQMATDSVIEMLDSSPVAVASVSNSHHLGVAGFYAEQLAEKGYVGFVTSNTFGAIAPVGGKTPILGNPPLALAVPRANADPVVIDMAPAVVARGNIAAAAKNGEKIPTNWAFDENGEPTDDPNAAMRGTISAIGGRKGVLLSMLIDLLLLTLTNAHLPSETSSVFTADGPPPSLGHIIIGFDPNSFEVPNATDRTEQYIASILSDTNQMHAPGEQRRAKRADSLVNGLMVSEEVWESIVGIEN